jgi:uncharacterized membrane protein YkoI
MSNSFAALLAAALMLGITPALADAPPQNAQPLSQLLATIEQNGDVAYFKEVDWDDDGYYEVEYRTRSGDDREVKVDPVSGQVRND